MDTSQTLFAFKLAAGAAPDTPRNDDARQDKWGARGDDAVAGCTDYRFEGNLRYGTRWSADAGVYC